ncbi:unnamed protein product [Sordaria macrospora k-hell]|uniref:WGS project CABT00000000 data, contig 2.29 n=1 Tax=Sordaria macrospora (strain ATCC MYA-333 / DSM 997 / K(L3346) / K-hell) TaxID=771870 RepID=F7W4V5_SORMK|nr:uncharacterized protein SMAC_06949 [Sordaria macrospora k-hell]CCC12542.1 unnamed protein product [Sordaria macrospora k-hell]
MEGKGEATISRRSLRPKITESSAQPADPGAAVSSVISFVSIAATTTTTSVITAFAIEYPAVAITIAVAASLPVIVFVVVSKLASFSPQTGPDPGSNTRASTDIPDATTTNSSKRITNANIDATTNTSFSIALATTITTATDTLKNCA